MPEDLIEIVNKMGSFTFKIHIDHFDCGQHTAQQDHFGSTQDDNQEQHASMDNFDCESNGKLDNSQQIDNINSDTRFPQSNEILRPLESNISTNVFMSMPNGVTVIHTTLQSLFSTETSVRQYLYNYSTNVSTG